MTRLCLATAFIAASLPAQPVLNIKDAIRCPNSADGRQPYTVSVTPSGDLRKYVINSPNAVCNDGTPAVIYVRPARAGAMEPDGPAANRWLIHFLGGSNCSDFEECSTRWCGIGQWSGRLMTTAFEGEFRSPGGLMNRNGVNRLADRNLVLLKYCSSDNWQGRKSDVVLRSESDPTRAFSLHFQGATIVSAIFDALERGVPGMPRINDATDVLIGGDSAGAVGARAHLDRLAARLKALNPNVRVRGQFESTFLLDFNGRQGVPAGDPNDPPYARKTESYNRIQAGQRNAQLDDSCMAAHPGAPYLCADDGYLTLHHITTPFFQMQDYQDPSIIDGLLENGVDATPLTLAQYYHDQLLALTNIRSTALERSAMTIAPGVGGRNCAIHVAYGDDDGFLGKKLRTGPSATAYSYYDLLWNWLFNLSPSVVLAQRPPNSPARPATDTICNARAPSTPALPAIVTVSSASYAIGAPVAPESIVAAFGSNLAGSTATATTNPWPLTLGGQQVTVTDARGVARQAPLYYVSPTQLLFLIPAGTVVGTAQIAVGTQRSSVDIAPTAPALYSAAQTGRGVAAASYIRINARGVRSEGLIFDPTTNAETPIPVQAGDQIYLILYGTGLRGGAASATVGGVSVPVTGPVAQSQYPGLDQVNLGPLPLRIGPGEKQIIIRQGEDLSNFVTVTFRAL